MGVNLCQGDAVFPLLPILLPEAASGAGGVGSPFSVDSLPMSGLRMTSEAAVDPDGGMFSVSASERSVVKSSGLFDEGVGMSNGSEVLGATAFGSVVRPSLRVSSVKEGSGCLVWLGVSVTRPAAGVCDVDAIKSHFSSTFGAGGVVSSEVVGALMEERTVTSYVDDGCLPMLKGVLVY